MLVEHTRIEHQGKLASVCGLLWRVEQKSSLKDPGKQFHVLTMDDGIEIISWHTSEESRESYLQAQGHHVTISAKAARARGQNYFYLQSMRLTCSCEKCKEPADNPESSSFLIL